MSDSIKLVSWNVNGIRAVLKKGFLDYFSKESPDILCLQETKAHQEQLDGQLTSVLKDHTQFWNSGVRKGYSGTLILTKKEPIEVNSNIGITEHDAEGRVITAEYKDYYLVTVYTPNSGRELERLKYRMEWDKAFLNFLKNLEKKKPVIFCGDLNVAHQEIDLRNPKTNRFNAGFTDEERSGFNNIISAGFIDTFREFNQEPHNYTWWSYMNQARERNIGWRIDYFCISPEIRKQLKTAFIRPQIMGSDHCPVGITIKGLKT